jgi:hypothetical protein
MPEHQPNEEILSHLRQIYDTPYNNYGNARTTSENPYGIYTSRYLSGTGPGDTKLNEHSMLFENINRHAPQQPLYSIPSSESTVTVSAPAPTPTPVPIVSTTTPTVATTTSSTTPTANSVSQISADVINPTGDERFTELAEGMPLVKGFEIGCAIALFILIPPCLFNFSEFLFPKSECEETDPERVELAELCHQENKKQEDYQYILVLMASSVGLLSSMFMYKFSLISKEKAVAVFNANCLMIVYDITINSGKLERHKRLLIYVLFIGAFLLLPVLAGALLNSTTKTTKRVEKHKKTMK